MNPSIPGARSRARADIEALQRIKSHFVEAQSLLGPTEISDHAQTKRGIGRNIEQAIEWIDAYLADQARGITPEEVALALIDAGDRQGWDRLTWTGDPEEYEGIANDVPPPSTVDFAQDLMRHFDMRRRS